MLPLPSPLSPFQLPEELEGRNWDTPPPFCSLPPPPLPPQQWRTWPWLPSARSLGRSSCSRASTTTSSPSQSDRTSLPNGSTSFLALGGSLGGRLAGWAQGPDFPPDCASRDRPASAAARARLPRRSPGRPGGGGAGGSPRLKSAAWPEDCLVDALLNKKGPPGLDVCVRVCVRDWERGGPSHPPCHSPRVGRGPLSGSPDAACSFGRVRVGLELLIREFNELWPYPDGVQQGKRPPRPKGTFSQVPGRAGQVAQFPPPCLRSGAGNPQLWPLPGSAVPAVSQPH